MSKVDNSNNSGRATHYLPRCQTLRVGAGRTINKLSRDSEVDRGTIAKIERKHPVSEHIAHRVFGALNALHRGKLQSHIEITTFQKS